MNDQPKSPTDKEREIFLASLKRESAEERAVFLDRACANDPGIRLAVEALLKHHKEDEFMRPPGLKSAPLSALEKPGDRIGRYKLLQQIGEGGCGVVYMAEQEEPVRRKIALKVIKLGMDTRTVIARFEAERQALALMDHPNIARVLDAGATETGRPYFVMELVRGIKITDYCDQNNLSTTDRLALFIKVCHAIQHAHQKGIIHRDVKPSNILVTLRDGVPVPKVIDFGIAKATGDQRLTDKTLFTAFQQFIGTPAYMSPEQAEMSELGVDTRSDIYSLGVLLYELLTGQPPFDSAVLLQAGLDEIRRVIRHQDPVRPSTRLSTMIKGDLTRAARQRHAEPAKLSAMIRGDLDWIVMKALEKDRSRRYETANGLAADLLRHLGNEPVLARPPSELYKLRKLVRRNKLACVAASAVVTSLVVGLAFSGWSFLREQQARRQAQAQRKIAESETAKSRQVARFLRAMLEGAGPEAALGRDSKMLQEIMETTKERLHTELTNQPEVEAELRATIARTYQQLGDDANAEAEYRRALSLQESVSGKDSTNVMQLVDSLAETMINRGELSAAEPMILGELARSRKMFGQAHPAVATSLHNLAVVRWERGDLAGADDIQRQALAQWRAFHDPKNISIALNDLALVQMDRGELAGAERSFRESLRIRKQLLPPGHPGLAAAENNLALALWYQGDLAGAEGIYNQALEMDRRLYHDGSPGTAATLNNLAGVLRDRNDFAAAEPLQRESLAMVEKRLGKEDSHAASARNNLAALLRRHGAAAADPAILREALELNPADVMTADALANVLELPSLTPVAANLKTASPGWRWTSSPPSSNWAEPHFSDALWASAPVVSGAAIYIPRGSKNPINYHTNLWLRREFELSAIPAGELVFRVTCNHDAQLFLNGAEIVPKADWSDTEVQLRAAGTGRMALNLGRNILAVHCEDADGGAPIDAQICVTRDSNAGRQELLEEFGGMIGREPARARLYEGRAALLARLGRWREAAKDLAKAIELDPTESKNWSRLAPLLLEMEDHAGYDRHRHLALARFRQPGDPIVAARIASLSLLVPAAGEDLTNALRLADVAAVAEYADAALGARQAAKGLAEYRRGQFANSLVWMDKALATAGQQSLPGWNHERERNLKTMAYLVESMAHRQMRDRVAAQVALSRGMAIIQTQFPPADSGEAGRDWPDWLGVQILLREARSPIF